MIIWIVFDELAELFPTTMTVEQCPTATPYHYVIRPQSPVVPVDTKRLEKYEISRRWDREAAERLYNTCYCRHSNPIPKPPIKPSGYG